MGSAAGNMMPHSNVYNPPRPPEVYTLPDNFNEILPSDVRRTFQHDDAGRVLFFTAPPLDRSHKGVSAASAGLGHGVKYLAGRTEWLAEREKKRKERDEKVSLEAKKRTVDHAERVEEDAVVAQAIDALDQWFRRIDEDTERWKTETGLAGWREPDKKGSVA